MPTLRFRNTLKPHDDDEPVNDEPDSTEPDTAEPDSTEAGPAGPSAPGEQPPGRRAPRRRWLLVLTAALLVLCVVAITGWVRAQGDADDLRRADSLRASASKAARTYAVDLTTYDYQGLDEQQATLKAESTKKFQSTFADSMKTLKPLFTELEANAKGTVVDAAVKSASSSAAVVLVLVDQQASSNKTDKPQTQASRLRVNLVREDGKWLLDKVDLV